MSDIRDIGRFIAALTDMAARSHTAVENAAHDLDTKSLSQASFELGRVEAIGEDMKILSRTAVRTIFDVEFAAREGGSGEGGE